jgi:hypothetical protein
MIQIKDKGISQSQLLPPLPLSLLPVPLLLLLLLPLLLLLGFALEPGLKVSMCWIFTS